jgi:hypothetical protein
LDVGGRDDFDVAAIGLHVELLETSSLKDRRAIFANCGWRGSNWIAVDFRHARIMNDSAAPRKA